MADSPRSTSLLAHTVMLLCTSLLFTIATVQTATATSGLSADLAKEPECGHEYPCTVQSTPREVDMKGEQAALPRELSLLGLSIKETSILDRDVYSCALYADSAFTQKELKPLTGPNKEALGKADLIYEKLLRPNAVKELRLRFCREIDAEDFIQDFDGALETRIVWWRAAARAPNPVPNVFVDAALGKLLKKEPTDDLNTLTTFFPSEEFKKDQELRFTWHPDGTLCTVVNGERKPDLKAPDLAWALFDAYLGEDPVSSAGKKSLVARVGLIETVMIRLVRLTIPEGSTWREKADDIRGEPEPYIQLEKDGELVAESTIADGWEVDFPREEENFWTLQRNASYKLTVLDSDLVFDDFVGEIVGLTSDDFTTEDGRILQDPGTLNPRTCPVVQFEVIKQ